jgi:hypothetical protein
MGDIIFQALAQFFDFAGQSGIVRIIIVILVLAGYWRGLQRAGADGAERVFAWLAVAAPLILWFAFIWSVAADGVFDPRPGARPWLPLAIFAPPLVGLIALTRSARVAGALDAIPAHWLVGLQVYRVFGAAFLVQLALGHFSPTIALPAGIGDVVVGLLAAPAALYLRANPQRGRALAIAWNVLGIADLRLAVALGTSIQIAGLRGAAGAPANAILYPLVMIPAFAVPLSLILHGMSIWQLRRAALAPSGRTAAVA